MNYTPFPTIQYFGSVAAWCEAEEKARKQAEREAEKRRRAEDLERRRLAREAEAKRKAEAERSRAMENKAYCETQLERLQDIYESIKATYYNAKCQVDYDESMNRHGVVISEKIEARHIKERDKLLQKLVTLETAINRLENQLAKAEYILSAPI